MANGHRDVHQRDSNVPDIDVQEAAARYCAVQQRVREEVRREIRKREQYIHADILRAPRGTRAKLMWSYIKSLNKRTRRPVNVIYATGPPVPGEKRKGYLTETAKSLLVVSAVCDARMPFLAAVRGRENTGITIEVDELASKLAKVNGRTGCGLDNISARTLKSLGERGIQCITDIFNRIFAGDEGIPAYWKEGKVNLLKKTNSTEGILDTFRPITITPVLYRLFTRIFTERIQEWMERNEILGEMQNGFRRDRGGDDNLFVLTSAIELDRKSVV